MLNQSTNHCIQPRSGHDKLPTSTPLPSGAKHHPDGEIPATLKVLRKVLKQMKTYTANEKT
jgi:hypothetical protein